MNASLIVCHARNRVIGAGNRMPWHLPADLRRFRETTMGHPVVMGRRTFDALGRRALPGRRNIVMSRGELAGAGFETAANPERLERLVGGARFFVIGGAEIYRLLLPFADTIYRTLLEAELDGDVLFPELDEREWRTREQGRHPADERNAYGMRFSVLSRVAPRARGAVTGNGGDKPAVSARRNPR